MPTRNRKLIIVVPSRKFKFSGIYNVSEDLHTGLENEKIEHEMVLVSEKFFSPWIFLTTFVLTLGTMLPSITHNPALPYVSLSDSTLISSSSIFWKRLYMLLSVVAEKGKGEVFARYP